VQFVKQPPQQVIDITLEHSYDFGPELPPPPKPMTPPETIPLRDTLEAGEGVWTTASLPRTSPDDPVLMRTFIRPDQSRPYALVGLLLMDSRRVMLHMVGGTADPGGDRGVKGPGVIPQDDRANLIAAWNGGFKGPHGGFGMVANGKEYRPLRNGLASIAVMQDGTIKMGDGVTTSPKKAWSPSARTRPAVRNRDRPSRDREHLGREREQRNSSWRSAVGLTRDGNLLYARELAERGNAREGARRRRPYRHAARHQHAPRAARHLLPAARWQPHVAEVHGHDERQPGPLPQVAGTGLHVHNGR
jgi:hypothetical protein